jgi:phosphoribosylanthranilate isomerase
MLIQIYEIQTPEEARMMIDLGVDHVGSVLVSAQEWKNPVLYSAIRQVRSSGRKSSLIPLFSQIDIIAKAVAYYQPDILHLCDTLPLGSSDEMALHGILERQATIRDRFPELELMRSIPIGENGLGHMVPSLELAALFEPVSDWFLTDTLISQGAAISDQDQPVHGYIGITGITCDWDIARALVQKSRIPVILAGGIGPANAAAGVARVMPAGVDSCTLTNRVDQKGRAIRFQKDPEKVKSMIASARQALLQ